MKIFNFISLRKSFVFFFSACILPGGMYCQCVSTFPYVEDFENAPAWTTVSVANGDWAWGTPNHTYAIQSAGSGNKCWSVGNLSGAFYNFWQQSYVVSPCFDFSNLHYPHIKFKLFYESEYHFDGGNLQYSTNGGNTWTNVGTYPEANDCNTQNWYNHNNVTYLNNPSWIGVKNGWSGNIQQGGSGWDPSSPSANCLGGNGPGQWITAEHCLNGLGGQASVLLRFTFAAGYSCNNFDGFAFDSVAISDGVAMSTDFTFSCQGNSFSFSPLNSTCPAANAWTWDFGDGTNSTAQNPSHTYATSGTYTVTLTASGGACNPPGVITHTLSTLNAVITSSTNVTCNGGYDGSAGVTVTPSGGGFTYNWIPFGGNNSFATGFPAGDYSVTVTDAGGCSATASVTITQPAPLAAYTASDFETDVYNTQIFFFDQSPGAIAWSWNFGDSTFSALQNPVHAYTASGIFEVVLTVNYANGCSDSIFHTLKINEDFTFYCPNSFTPDDDGINEIFLPLGLGWDLNSYDLWIYDRWGQKIFHTTNSAEGWNGKTTKGKEVVQQDIYLWRVNLRDERGGNHEYTGKILLIN
jgi:gliding motility-associated-like protein